MAVIVDLTRPLTSKITVDGKALLIEYEGLPIICYQCGRYGHLADICPMTTMAVEQVADETTPAQRQEEVEPPARAPTAEEIDATNPYGAWMIAPRRGRRFLQDQKKGPDSRPAKPTNLGSRFDLLRNNEDLQDLSDQPINAPHPNSASPHTVPPAAHIDPPATNHTQPPRAPNSPKEVKKKTSQRPHPKETQKPTPEKQTIYQSKAYQAYLASSSAPHILDNSSHSVALVPHPKAQTSAHNATSLPPNTKPKTQNHHQDTNKENIKPKPPDRTQPSPGIKINTGPILALAKNRPKDTSSQPSDRTIMAITQALSNNYEEDDPLLDDSIEHEEPRGGPNFP